MEHEGSTGAKLVPANAGHPRSLAGEWRRLSRAATFVAVLTSPALHGRPHRRQRLAVAWALLATIVAVAPSAG